MKRDISLTIARNAQRSTAQSSRSGNRPLLKDLLDRMFVNAQPLDRAICVFSAPGMHDGPYPIWLKYSISTGYIKLILLSQNVTNFRHKLQNLSASGGLRPPDPLPGLCPWTPLGDFRSPDPLSLYPHALCRTHPLQNPWPRHWRQQRQNE